MLLFKKIFGVLFLLGAVGCAGVAYMLGGPNWREPFEFRQMMHEGLWFVIATPVCLLLGVGLMFGGKKSPAAITPPSA